MKRPLIDYIGSSILIITFCAFIGILFWAANNRDQFSKISTDIEIPAWASEKIERDRIRIEKRVAHITLDLTQRVEDDILEFGFTTSPISSYYYIDTEGLKHTFGFYTPYFITWYK